MRETQSVKWITAQWLQDNQDKVTLIDTQPDVHDYIKEHIPGAVYLNENHFRAFHFNLPTRYSPGPCIELLLQQTGLQRDKPVVVYGSSGKFSHAGDGLEQTMVAYCLARFGHTQICLLDGGLEKWVAAGLNLSKLFPQIQASTWQHSIRNDLFVNYNQFVEIKDSPDVVTIDVRPRDVYEGKGIWSKLGHIPGAISLPWPVFMDHKNPRLLSSTDKIKKIASSRGAVPEKTIILYCGTGREATSSFLVFKWLLQYPSVKLYEGSFTEWCTRDENPTVTGPGSYQD